MKSPQRAINLYLFCDTENCMMFGAFILGQGWMISVQIVKRR